MKIIVVGCGKVGHYVAKNLVRENHEVYVIDNNQAIINDCENMDCIGVVGSGANAQKLIEANVRNCDIIIATTHSDEINMLCCLMGKQLGAKHAIARVRDTEYNDSLVLLQHGLGIDMTINPDRATALEISRLLRFPFAINVETFAKGRVEMVEYKVQEKDCIVGLPLKAFKTQLKKLPQVLVTVVERDNRVYIPGGDFVIRTGDRVHVAGDQMTITQFFTMIGKNNQKIRDILMLGGSRTAYYLAQMADSMGMRTSIIEIDPKKQNLLSELLPDTTVIGGDGTDQELLSNSGLESMDAFITLCDRDEENLITGLYAASVGVPKVIVKNNRVAYMDIFNHMGLESIISPRYITTSTILRYVRARANGGEGSVERLYRLVGGKVEALEFIVQPGMKYIGIPIKDLKIRKNSLLAVIVRMGRVFVPFGSDHLEEDDSVIVISMDSGITSLDEVIRYE